MARPKGIKNSFGDETQTIKECLRLHTVEKLSATEIAKRVGWTYKTVIKYLGPDFNPKIGQSKFGSGDVANKVMPNLDEIYHRYIDGERLVDLASEYGIAKSYLFDLLKKNNFQLAANQQEAERRSASGMLSPYGIGAFEFVDAWQSSSTLDEVRERLRMPLSAIVGRAYNYKKRGIPLKKLSQSTRISWDELKEFASLFLEEK